MLCCAVDKAQQGGHQYLSGTLHNVAKALANAQPQPDLHKALLAAGYGSSKALTFSTMLHPITSASVPLPSDAQFCPQRGTFLKHNCGQAMIAPLRASHP